MQAADGVDLFHSMKPVLFRTENCKKRESNVCILLVEAVAFVHRHRSTASWRQALGFARYDVDLCCAADSADVCPGCPCASCNCGRGPLPAVHGDALGRSGGGGCASDGFLERIGAGAGAGGAYGCPALALLPVQSASSHTGLKCFAEARRFLEPL
jgi:hypothetical protein